MSDDRNSPGRDKLFVCLLLILSAILWSLRVKGPLDLRYDAGVYYILGSSIAQGQGYRLLNEPGHIEAVQYPPGLPLFIAAHQKILGSSELGVVGPWLRISYLVMTTVLLLAIYAMSRRWLSPEYAFLATVICAMMEWTTFLSEVAFADVPFALLTVLFVILHYRGRARSEIGAAVCAVAAYLFRTAGMALFVAWVAEAIIQKKFKQAAIRAAICAAPVIAWQGYVAHVIHAPEYAHPAYEYERASYQYYNVSYGENLSLLDPFHPEKGLTTPGKVAARTLSNMAVVPTSLGETLTSPQQYWWFIMRPFGKILDKLHVHYWWALPPFVIGFPVLASLSIFAFRREWLVLFYLAASIGLMCLTPWPEQFVRYLWVVAPFITLAVVMSSVATMEWCRRRDAMKHPDATGEEHKPGGILSYRRVQPQPGKGMIREIRDHIWFESARIAGLLALVIIFGSQLHALVRIYRWRGIVPYVDAEGANKTCRMLFWDPAWRSYDNALMWLKDHSKPGDIVVASAPHWAYLRTGLQAVQPPFIKDPDESQRLVDTVPATYLIADSFTYPGGTVTQWYSEPMLKAHPELWEVAFTSHDKDTRGALTVYRRVRAGNANR